MGLTRWCSGKGNLPDNAKDTGDMGSVPGSGRSPGEGNGNPFQYYCLENPMDRGAWRATVYAVTRVGHNWAYTHEKEKSIYNLLRTFIYLEFHNSMRSWKSLTPFYSWGNWSQWNSVTLAAGIQTWQVTKVGDRKEIPFEEFPCQVMGTVGCTVYSDQRLYWKRWKCWKISEISLKHRRTCTPMFISALFIIARTWKQPRCPSADEWIRKLWYIYTMECYSAVKKNSFESVLMRWMKLEPIIQSEVNQKDKEHYSILTHIYGI